MKCLLEKARYSSNRLQLSAPRSSPADADPIRVWLVDDDAQLGELLATILNRAVDLDCARLFSSTEAVLQALALEPPPQVLLLGLKVNGQDGLSAVSPVKSLAPCTSVLILSTFNDYLENARARLAGALGLVAKYEVEQIIEHVRQTRRNLLRRPLSALEAA